MANVTVKGMAALRRRLNSKAKVVINKTIRNKSLRDKIGKIVADDIRKNFNEPAGDATQAFREFLEQFNKTHPDYKRSKINITFTGELLDDLASNVKADTINLGFIIEHSKKPHSIYKSGGTFSPRKVQVTSLKTQKTRNVTQKRTHKEISEFIQKKGYDYLKVTDDAKRKIIKLVRDEIFDNIKKEFTTK